jgi:ribosome-binding factor A
MKHRLERVNELIRRELGDLITREYQFESKLVTIQQDRYHTRPLNMRTSYVSIIGGTRGKPIETWPLHLHTVHSFSKRWPKDHPQVYATPPFSLDESIERGAPRLKHP